MDSKKTFHCTRCDETLSFMQAAAKEWKCPDGQKHEVQPKTYYSPVPSWRVYVTEERFLTMDDGRKRLIPARSVQFVKGTYTTCDPEDQYALDVKEGLISADDWQKKFIPKEELLAKKERELEARERKIQEQNDLLAKVMAEKNAEKSKAGK